MDGAAREHLLLEAAEQLAEIGSWEWCPETGELVWSRNMLRIFGLDPAAEVPSLERIVEFTHPDSERGTHFDPKILDLLLDNLEGVLSHRG